MEGISNSLNTIQVRTALCREMTSIYTRLCKAHAGGWFSGEPYISPAKSRVYSRLTMRWLMNSPSFLREPSIPYTSSCSLRRMYARGPYALNPLRLRHPWRLSNRPVSPHPTPPPLYVTHGALVPALYPRQLSLCIT